MFITYNIHESMVIKQGSYKVRRKIITKKGEGEGFNDKANLDHMLTQELPSEL